MVIWSCRKSQMHQMTSEWHWKVSGQKYPMNTKYWPLSMLRSKLMSVSLYIYTLLRYLTFHNPHWLACYLKTEDNLHWKWSIDNCSQNLVFNLLVCFHKSKFYRWWVNGWKTCTPWQFLPLLHWRNLWPSVQTEHPSLEPSQNHLEIEWWGPEWGKIQQSVITVHRYHVLISWTFLYFLFKQIYPHRCTSGIKP